MGCALANQLRQRMDSAIFGVVFDGVVILPVWTPVPYSGYPEPPSFDLASYIFPQELFSAAAIGRFFPDTWQRRSNEGPHATLVSRQGYSSLRNSSRVRPASRTIPAMVY